MISFIGAIIIGGLAGLVAKMLTPGRDELGGECRSGHVDTLV